MRDKPTFLNAILVFEGFSVWVNERTEERVSAPDHVTTPQLRVGLWSCAIVTPWGTSITQLGKQQQQQIPS